MPGAVPCARDGGRGAHEHTGTVGALRHQIRVRSARLHFPTRWTVLACSNSACLRGPKREPVFLFASARGGFDAHGMLRSSSLAYLRWGRGCHWERFAGIYPLALTSIPPSECPYVYGLALHRRRMASSDRVGGLRLPRV